MSRHWHIQGFDSTTPIVDVKVRIGELSEKRLKELLVSLAARAGHTYDEILGAYVRRRTRLANDLLLVHRSGPHPVYMCGSNPHFIARVVNEA